MVESALKYFINSDTVASLDIDIQKLQKEKEALDTIIDNVIDRVLIKKFGIDQLDYAKRNYVDEIEQMRTSIYKKKEFVLSRLVCLRDKVC